MGKWLKLPRVSQHNPAVKHVKVSRIIVMVHFVNGHWPLRKDPVMLFHVPELHGRKKMPTTSRGGIKDEMRTGGGLQMWKCLEHFTWRRQSTRLTRSGEQVERNIHLLY
jgi:hypothetical protein